MTSDQIAAARIHSPNTKTEACWEIAYQLAVMNERNALGLAGTEAGKRDAGGQRGGWPPRSPSYDNLLVEFFNWRIAKTGVREDPSCDIRVALRFMFEWLSATSVPPLAPEPAGQDSTPIETNDAEWLKAQLQARDLVRKTDREQQS